MKFHSRSQFWDKVHKLNLPGRLVVKCIPDNESGEEIEILKLRAEKLTRLLNNLSDLEKLMLGINLSSMSNYR